MGHSSAESCAASYTGLGHLPMASVSPADIKIPQNFAKLRAMKRWARRNAKRAAAGRARYEHTGKSAVEHTRAAASCAFELASKDPSTGVRRNIARDIKLPAREKLTARSYEIGGLDLVGQNALLVEKGEPASRAGGLLLSPQTEEGPGRWHGDRRAACAHTPGAVFIERALGYGVVEVMGCSPAMTTSSPSSAAPSDRCLVRSILGTR